MRRSGELEYLRMEGAGGEQTMSRRARGEGGGYTWAAVWLFAEKASH
jgi:hypothetical protein